MSYRTSSTLLLASIIGVGVFATIYRDDAGRIANELLARVSSDVPAEAPSQPGGMPAPQVPVAEVVTREVAPSVEFTGYLEATEVVELRPRVGGAIDAVSVPEGGIVRPGDLLFQIDTRPYDVALASAKAQLRLTDVMLEQAAMDLQRTASLAPKGAVSRKTLDDARATVRQREAQVEIAKSAVAAAELDLSFTRVTAPIGGRVDRALVTEGNLVSAGSSGAATLLTTIVSTDPLYVYFDIDEATFLDFSERARVAGNIAGKLPVRVGLMTEANFPHLGELDFLGNRVDRGTGTIRARAVVNNSDGKLTPGLFARVQLITARPAQTVLIDDQAIGIDQGRRYVLVVGEGNTAEYRPIETGSMIDGLRVVSAGLDPAEKIIVKGLVRPGMQVVPEMISMLPGPSAEDVRAAAETQEARR